MAPDKNKETQPSRVFPQAQITFLVFLQVESFLKRIRKWDTEFFCVGKAASEVFNVPKPEEVLPRITANLDYFCVNYAVLCQTRGPGGMLDSKRGERRAINVDHLCI